MQFLGVLALVALCTLLTGNIIFGALAAFHLAIVAWVFNAILGALLDGMLAGLRRVFGAK